MSSGALVPRGLEFEEAGDIEGLLSGNFPTPLLPNSSSTSTSAVTPATTSTTPTTTSTKVQIPASSSQRSSVDQYERRKQRLTLRWCLPHVVKSPLSWQESFQKFAVTAFNQCSTGKAKVGNGCGRMVSTSTYLTNMWTTLKCTGMPKNWH